MNNITTVAAIGSGVIGGGWVARFLLNGIDVNLYDPSDDAVEKVHILLSKAMKSVRKLVNQPLPTPGKLKLCMSIREAVETAEFVQESTPENLELKKTILCKIDQYAPLECLIASSTSGLRPSDLQTGLSHPERLLVGHPFNPVYLIPLVELCGGMKTDPQTLEKASSFYSNLGMHPLVVRKEIDAFIADRLMEALWREALWLIEEDVATVEEIDDAVRYGPGLRWAMMGTFQVYRIAGGEAGMGHFLSQFGPALKWPWTKLMDVPDLDEELISKISDQSDAQAKGLSISELENIRDQGLVEILKSLQRIDWAAGKTLTKYENHLRSMQAEYSSPLLDLYTTTVHADWIDYNGHMTEHRYLQAFGEATDALLEDIGMTSSYLTAGHSVYTVETHIRHLAEAKEGELLKISTQILGKDPKRLRILHILSRAATDEVVATAEHMLLHVNTKTLKACPFLEPLDNTLNGLWAGHSMLVVPMFAGSRIQDLDP